MVGIHRSGCGAARLARFIGVEEVAGSNPVTPTIIYMAMSLSGLVAFASQVSTGCSAARLAHLLREQGVASSNLATPTIKSTLAII